MAKNLFNNAKSSEKKKEVIEKTQIERVNINSYNKEDDFFSIFEKMAEITRLEADIKNKQTKSDILSAEIKTIGKKEWIKLIESNKDNTGSFILESTNSDEISQVMFVPSDKYIKINEQKANQLRVKYNDNIITEKTTYSFNPSLLEKYADILSDLIESCDEINNNDKENLIVAETDYSISKGTIDKISDYVLNNDLSISDVISDISPVFSLKGFQVINK